MMKFALLASGSKGNCFLFFDENTALMIDCGGTQRWLKEQLAHLDVHVEDLDAVLITHTHSDHIGQIRMVSNRAVYAAVKVSGIADLHAVQALMPFQIEHCTITPLPLSHDAEKTMGYVIETWNEKLVYITDTGYVKEEYFKKLKGADYIILESNHDSDMLMRTSRPQYIKMRIAGDDGHLCNEECARILDAIVTEKTRQIVLAHISQQGNTPALALQVSREALLRHAGPLHPDLVLSAAQQFECITGGDWPYEKMDCGLYSTAVGLERMADRKLSGIEKGDGDQAR